MGFQNFDEFSDPAQGPPRIRQLREAMRAAGLDAWLVPHGDEYRNEYLPPCSERLRWLTGFSGSAGFCIVTQDKALLFVDGRYTLQAAAQTDPSTFTIESLHDSPPGKWLAENMPKGARIGYDPWVITISEHKSLEKQARQAGAELVASGNLVDSIWADRPPPPLGPARVHELRHAGIAAEAKLAQLQEEIARAGANFCLLTDPASVAWAFNVRGSDVTHNPLLLARAVLPASGRPFLFVAPQKLDEQVQSYLSALADCRPPQDLAQQLRDLAAGGVKFLADPERCPTGFAELIRESGGEIVEGRDPVILPRAVKNETEIAGARAAHLRDGVAMVRFLSWLDRQEPGSVTEISAARQLESFRVENAVRMNSELRDISFDTISGVGANGAIVHYRVTERSNAPLLPGSLYLVDSGGQYDDGTTDITRTVAIGAPPPGAAEDFTLVLKGHIAVATARFPAGARGMDIDPLARAALWRRGRDYDHGTGHGVGSYLSVHEGPQSLSKRGSEPLLAGMILSNEPGMYRAGRYGIRIENLLLVLPAREIAGGNVAVHEFETLSLAPIDQRLIDFGLLDEAEKQWLFSYHRRVRQELSPYLEDEERAWLEQATREP